MIGVELYLSELLQIRNYLLVRVPTRILENLLMLVGWESEMEMKVENRNREVVSSNTCLLDSWPSILSIKVNRGTSLGFSKSEFKKALEHRDVRRVQFRNVAINGGWNHHQVGVGDAELVVEYEVVIVSKVYLGSL